MSLLKFSLHQHYFNSSMLSIITRREKHGMLSTHHISKKHVNASQHGQKHYRLGLKALDFFVIFLVKVGDKLKLELGTCCP